MMIRPTGITISFGGTDGSSDIRPVVARIFGWPSDGSEAICREMVVPAGGAIEQELPQGLYNVELNLPSGRILQRNVRIDEDTHEDFRFLEDFAPAASFSLQEAVGRSDDILLADAAAASGNTSSADYSDALEKANAAARSRPVRRSRKSQDVKSRGDAAAQRPPPPSTASVTLHKGSFDWDRPDPSGDAYDVIQPEQQSGNSALWRIAGAHGDYGAEGRRWALVTLPGGGRELISLPLPWFCVGSNEHSPAELLVDPSRSGASTTVAVRDARLAGLLAYLDRGQAGIAAPLLNDLESDGLIEGVIFDKMANPLAACAAAYVGLAVNSPGTAEKWDAWLANCMNRFPAIADAAIVHARRLLLRPTGSEDNGLAAEALRAAAAGGVPYFSAGVLLLREMLFLLSADHPDLKPLAERAARVASRVDPGQIFTVLRYAPISKGAV